MKSIMQECIEYKDRWFKGEKLNPSQHALTIRRWEAHQDDFAFQVSRATDAQAYLESRVFNIAILPHTPEAPKLSLGTSLHMTVSRVGELVVYTWKRHVVHSWDLIQCPGFNAVDSWPRTQTPEPTIAAQETHFSLTWKRNLKFFKF